MAPRARGLKRPLRGLQRAIRLGFSATGPVPPSWRGGALPARALPSAHPWEVASPSMAALKKKNGLASGPAPSLAQGPSTVCRTPTKRIPACLSGALPPYPRRPWLLRSLRSRPAPRRGASRALCPSLTPGARVRSLRSPLRALAPVFASGRRALAPSGAGAGGAGLGSLPSLSPAPGGRFRRSWRRRVAGSLVRWLCGGVLWPLSRSFLPLPPCCVPRGLAWLPGRAPPWAFRSAPRRWRCPVRWPFAGSRRPPPPLRSPVRGRGACPPLAAVAGFARRRSSRAWRPRGLSRFRSHRRPFRFAGAGRRARSPPCSPPVAARARSRAGAPGRVRGGLARRLSCPARAGLGWRAVRRLPLARRRWRGVAPGALVWVARAGLRPARSGLACCRGVAPRRAPLPRFSPARRVRVGCRARPAGLAAAGSPTRRFFSLPFSFYSRCFFPPGLAFLVGCFSDFVLIFSRFFFAYSVIIIQ